MRTRRPDILPMLLLLVTAFLFSACVHTSPPHPAIAATLQAQDNLTVVCFGDSVTGVYYHSGGRRAYTDMLELGLRQALPGKSVTAVNAGISGNTTVDALKRIEKDVLAHRPDLVTVMFGLNDMTRVSLADYRANLKTIITMCRANGAEVILCTPNNVRDTASRPTATLEAYVAVVRDVALEENTALADCYAVFEHLRTENAFQWATLMSDEIHPNMHGHKQIAMTMATAITGKRIDLANRPAPEPALPHTLQRIQAKQPLNILAMPPYDSLLVNLLGELAPGSPVTMTRWETAGQSMTEIETAAKGVREKRYDLVFIAVPASAAAETPEAFVQRYSWVLNFSLSFGYQEWDVVAVPPSLAASVTGEDAQRDAWAKRLIQGQDFALIEGKGGSKDAAEKALRTWLQQQLKYSDPD